MATQESFNAQVTEAVHNSVRAIKSISDRLDRFYEQQEHFNNQTTKAVEAIYENLKSILERLDKVEEFLGSK